MKIQNFSGRLLITGLLSLALMVAAGCQTIATQKQVETASIEAQSEGIILRPSDVIKVSFPGSPNLDTTQPIRRDGKMVFPLIGEIEATGLAPAALQEKLIKLYTPQIGSKEVLVTVQASSFPVFITGSVVRPGKILSDHPITALEAVMEAGGFDKNTANMSAVKVSRMENGVMKTYKLDLKAALEGGESGKPFYLKPNDILFIPERLQIF